jgi:hypothetical protein
MLLTGRTGKFDIAHNACPYKMLIRQDANDAADFLIDCQFHHWSAASYEARLEAMKPTASFPQPSPPEEAREKTSAALVDATRF